MTWWLITIEIIYIILIIFTSYRIIVDTRSSSKTLAYLLTVFFLPVIGMIIYFSVGINYKKRQIYSKKVISGHILQTIVYKMHEQSIESYQDTKVKELDTRIPQFLFQSNNNPLTSNNKVEILRNGEEKFPSVLQAIKDAKHTIHLEYYIMEDGVLSRQLEDLLIKKAEEGVKVRVIYDDFGSSSIRKTVVQRLRNKGIEIYPFYKVKLIYLANRMNYRNHRKIAVIDGKIGFTGGINWSDRYSNEHNQEYYYWRDTHIRLEGPIVASLQAVFLADWNFCVNQNVEIQPELFSGINEKVGDKSVQLAADGPDYAMPTILYSLLQAIHSAKEYIYATTPYYIPDESLQNALCVIAKSGVDVRLLVPYKSDSRFVNAASRSYYKELLNAGVRIYRYKKGFVHAKTIAIDDQIAIIGTANLDYRSFDLNFEVNTIVYNSETTQELRQHFEEDLLDAEELNKEKWMNRNKIRTFFEKIAGLLSPLL